MWIIFGVLRADVSYSLWNIIYIDLFTIYSSYFHSWSFLLRFSSFVHFGGLDLVPRLLYGRSEHVDVLIESGVARHFRVGGVQIGL